jgi:hypothetical protein
MDQFLSLKSVQQDKRHREAPEEANGRHGGF